MLGGIELYMKINYPNILRKIVINLELLTYIILMNYTQKIRFIHIVCHKPHFTKNPCKDFMNIIFTAIYYVQYCCCKEKRL